jgi:hypothetical protein
MSEHITAEDIAMPEYINDEDIAMPEYINDEDIAKIQQILETRLDPPYNPDQVMINAVPGGNPKDKPTLGDILGEVIKVSTLQLKQLRKRKFELIIDNFLSRLKNIYNYDLIPYTVGGKKKKSKKSKKSRKSRKSRKSKKSKKTKKSRKSRK